MYRKNILPYALTAMLTVASACGGSDKAAGPSGDAPTAVESANMVEALQAISSLAVGVGFDNKNSRDLAAQTVSYSNSANCPNGGSTSVSGNYTIGSASQSGYTYDYTVTQTYNGCKATGGGKVFTFNGEGVTLTVHFVYTANPLTYNISYHETGNISWAGSSKSGTCAININLTYSLNNSGVANYSGSGTYCGNSINL